MLLRGSAETALRALTGVSVERWLDIELPKIQNPRVDLLGESADGALVHLELQSSNDVQQGGERRVVHFTLLLPSKRPGHTPQPDRRTPDLSLGSRADKTS